MVANCSEIYTFQIDTYAEIVALYDQMESW